MSLSSYHKLTLTKPSVPRGGSSVPRFFFFHTRTRTNSLSLLPTRRLYYDVLYCIVLYWKLLLPHSRNPQLPTLTNRSNRKTLACFLANGKGSIHLSCLFVCLFVCFVPGNLFFLTKRNLFDDRRPTGRYLLLIMIDGNNSFLLYR